MDIKQAKAEVSSALVEVAEQLETILNHKGKIPQIELDLILSNTQRLYTYLITLNKLNASGKVDANEKTDVPTIKPEEISKLVQSEVGKLRDEMFRTFSSPQRGGGNTPEPMVEPVVEPTTFTPPPTPKPQTGPSPEKLAAIKQNPFIGKTIMPDGEVAEKVATVNTEVEKPAPVVEIKIEEPVLNKVTEPVVVQEEVKPLENVAPTVTNNTIVVPPPTVQPVAEPVAQPVVSEKVVETMVDNTLAGRLRAKPITSIKSAIGINEKFQYLNDLFKGNVQDYNESLDTLNNFTSLGDAEAHFNTLRNKFGWDMETPSASGLYELVVRRYIK